MPWATFWLSGWPVSGQPDTDVAQVKGFVRHQVGAAVSTHGRRQGLSQSDTAAGYVTRGKAVGIAANR
jgi:hypothetical protein